MTTTPATTPRFEWRFRDDSGWRWSYAHTLTGPCPACLDGGPESCPRCGGRLHCEVALTVGRLDGALLCQDERTDGAGRQTRVRSAESQAQIRAKLDQEEAERRAMWGRWAKGAAVVWLTVGTIITVGGLLVGLVSMVLYGP